MLDKLDLPNGVEFSAANYCFVPPNFSLLLFSDSFISFSHFNDDFLLDCVKSNLRRDVLIPLIVELERFLYCVEWHDCYFLISR